MLRGPPGCKGRRTHQCHCERDLRRAHPQKPRGLYGGGVNQIGDDQARSWIVAGAPAGSGRWLWIASSALQRGVGTARPTMTRFFYTAGPCKPKRRCT